MIGNLYISAKDIDEAIEKAESPLQPLPDNGVYLEDSFAIDKEGITSLHNE